MTIDQTERELFGQPLKPLDRLVAGVIVIVGALGHLLLGFTALVLVYAVLFAV